MHKFGSSSAAWSAKRIRSDLCVELGRSSLRRRLSCSCRGPTDCCAGFSNSSLFENPQWGYPRIVGELKGVGITVSATTVRAWLRAAGFGPAGKRGKTTWREFVRVHRESILAVDVFTFETI